MNKRIAMSLAALSLVSVVALAGCGGGKSDAPAAGGGGNEVVVNMKSTAFEKSNVEVKAGTTVKWVNLDVTDHSVYEGEPDSGKYLFQSKDFGEKQSFSYKFDKPGTYKIFCNTGAHHLIGMKMTVTVK